MSQELDRRRRQFQHRHDHPARPHSAAGRNHPRRRVHHRRRRQRRQPGGGAARAGGNVTFIARVGRDMLGEPALAGFRQGRHRRRARVPRQGRALGRGVDLRRPRTARTASPWPPAPMRSSSPARRKKAAQGDPPRPPCCWCNWKRRWRRCRPPPSSPPAAGVRVILNPGAGPAAARRAAPAASRS